MNVLIACEESQVVCKEFRLRGHEAYSNDIIETSGENPEWHLQMDVFEAIKLKHWDLMIAFPPCTYLTVTGNKWFYHPDDKHLPIHQRRPHPKFPDRQRKRADAFEFFMGLVNAPIDRIAIENPVGIMSTHWRKPDQIIQPYQFGHPEPKKTCLWLRNLPLLKPTKIVEPEYMISKSGKRLAKWYYSPSYTPERQTLRSKTFRGIAEAMAEQWSLIPTNLFTQTNTGVTNANSRTTNSKDRNHRR